MLTLAPPSLRALSGIPAELAANLPELPSDGFELFLVTSDGQFLDQRYTVGEVLLCRDPARTGDVTVLVAHGVGRPRLGTVEGLRFRGDGGEPCHSARWRSAGKVVARFKLGNQGWFVEVGAQAQGEQSAGGSTEGATQVGSSRSSKARAAAGGEGESPPAAQLPLFMA